MPRERVKHGKQFVLEPEKDVAPGETPSLAGKPYFPGEKIPEGSILREESSLDVAWNRESGWVQIGIDAPRDWWERFIESYKNSPEQISFSAWIDVLDRSEINHLIRTLRRARDTAYGADE